ncbi:MAG: hypothetical protein JWP61_1774 [Friedmanniella sp.]|nr:hypothetical protein [Friedmanniella sp.]
MIDSPVEPTRLLPRPAALLDLPRASLARAVRGRIAGEDFEQAHARIWYAPGPRWFTEDDVIWRVHADTAMFIGGIRALLLQSLHPVAMHGVSEHSAFRTDPWGRLQRTSTFLATTTYGPIPDAERQIRIVRAVHKRIVGVTPDGEPYAASDPHLLGWVHLAEMDSFLAAHQSFGSARLDPAEADTYVAQSAVVAEKLGVQDAPRTVAEMEAQLRAYAPELRMSPAARDTIDLLLRQPPLTGPARAGYSVLAAAAVSILPLWARTALSLPALPLTDRVLIRPLARSALAAIRWSLAGEPTV